MQTYIYDRYGNRTFDAAHTTYPPPLTNPAINATDNRIAANQGYGYDVAGNLTNAPNQSFTYDAENRMVSYNGGNPQSGGGTFSYDGDGRRVKKIASSGTTIFVYNAMGQLVAEYTDQSQQGTGGTSYLTADHLGTPRVVTDASGNVKARHDYLPFGEELQAGVGGRTTSQGYSQSSGIRQGYTGYERDSETNLDYAQNRYYSSTQGRFTSPDPLLESGEPAQPQSWNRYAYTINNPLKYIDPDGLRYVQRTLEDGQIQFGWCPNDECYENALNTGWSVVTFDESQPFEFECRCGSGGDLYGRYRLNPDGTHGYADVLDGNYHAMSTDWGAQLGIGGLLKSLFRGIEGWLARQAATQAATQATAQTSSGLRALISSIEKEIADSGAKTMGQRYLAIERALGKQGLEALGKVTAEGIKITSKKEITTIAKDGTITITSRATGQVIKQIR